MRHLIIASLILAGCAEGGGPSDETFVPTNPATPQTVPLTGEELQGVYLLGNIADGLAAGGKYISVVSPMGFTIGVDGQALVVRNASGPVRLTFPFDLPAAAPNTGRLRIEGLGATGYLVDYVDATGTVSPYCDSTESSDAVAMLGEWTTNGEHLLDPNKVTFACQESGKAATCIKWGYPPGTAGDGDPMWDLHQACTQMARANYCMDGKSHTREKTPIWIRDAIPAAEPENSGSNTLPPVPASYPPVPPPPDQVFFEAAWAPKQKVLCLDKLRWNDFEPGTLCNGTIPDPRVDKTARYCEDSHLDLRPTDHTLLNGSKTMDLALHRWSNGSDQLTTVHGFIVDAADPMKSVPPAGFNAPALSNEGYLLRNPTGDFFTCGCLVPAYRLRDSSGSDSLIGPDSILPLLPPGYTHNLTTDFEGWLITTPGSDRKAFYLYQRGTDYLTATKAPFTIPPYRKVGGPNALPIGYVIAASL